MNKLIVLLMIMVLSGCVKAGEFSPERHAQYEQGHPECNKSPEKCVNGVPW